MYVKMLINMDDPVVKKIYREECYYLKLTGQKGEKNHLQVYRK